MKPEKCETNEVSPETAPAYWFQAKGYTKLEPIRIPGLQYNWETEEAGVLRGQSNRVAAPRGCRGSP